MAKIPAVGSKRRFMRWLAAQLLLLVAVVVALLIIRWWGEAIEPGALTAKRETALALHSSALLHVLLDLTIVILAGRWLGWVFARFQQPQVIGEVAAGILLGPSLLGWLSPDIEDFLFPASVMPYLSIVAQLGIVLYIFIVGLEFDAAVLSRRGSTAISISMAGMLVPLLLGAALALGVYPALAAPGVSFTVFSLFLGAAMAVTAFPVLARILTDRRMHTTELGQLALACAATEDVVDWCFLAVIIGLAQAQFGRSLAVVGLTIGYAVFMFLVARPLLKRWVPKDGQLNRQTIVPVFAGLFLSAAATESIGVHAIFGAFLFGAVIPSDSTIARQFRDKHEMLVTVVLLPAFFAVTGMRTQIGLLNSGSDWLWCGLIIAIASLGKLGGTVAAARSGGLSWRHATALGVLMNTRGLMEIIVLNIGLELGVISPRLFAMMVLMALATTLATTPLLALLGVGRGQRHELAELSVN